MPPVMGPWPGIAQPIVDLQVAFNAQPNATGGPTPVWTSLAHRLVSFRTKSGKRYELDQANLAAADYEASKWLQAGVIVPAQKEKP